MLYGKTRQGAVNSGAVRSGPVRFGALRCDAARKSTARCGNAIKYHKVQCGAVRRIKYTTAQHSTTPGTIFKARLLHQQQEREPRKGHLRKHLVQESYSRSVPENVPYRIANRTRCGVAELRESAQAARYLLRHVYHLGVTSEAHLESGLQLAGAASLGVGLSAEGLMRKDEEKGEEKKSNAGVNERPAWQVA